MKTFESGFFALDHFIAKKEDFDFLEAAAKTPWHIAYNVNDPFFSIMGASVVSVLETTRTSRWCSICLPMDTVRKPGQGPAAG